MVASIYSTYFSLQIKAKHMKKILFILFCILVYSCYPTKQTTTPAIQFKLYDATTKMPIENVQLFTNDAFDSELYWVEYSEKSTSKGLLSFKEKQLELKGDVKNFMPVVNTEFQFRKEGYKASKIKLFDSFKINEKSTLKKTYVSDLSF